MIIMILAMDEHQLIGKNHKMPWYLPQDLQLFKKATLHQHVLMGRITYENLPKPLLDRHMHIASHKEGYINDIASFVQSFHNKTLFVAGGAQIYQACYPYADELWISHVKGIYDGDTYFTLPYTKDFYCIEEIEYEQFVFRKWKRG